MTEERTRTVLDAAWDFLDAEDARAGRPGAFVPSAQKAHIPRLDVLLACLIVMKGGGER